MITNRKVVVDGNPSPFRLYLRGINISNEHKSVYFAHANKFKIDFYAQLFVPFHERSLIGKRVTLSEGALRREKLKSECLESFLRSQSLEFLSSVISECYVAVLSSRCLR